MPTKINRQQQQKNILPSTKRRVLRPQEPLYVWMRKLVQEPQGEVFWRFISTLSVEGRMTARVQRAIRCMSAGLMFSTRDTFASSKNSNARRETVFSTITTSGFSATILATAIFKCSLSWRVREELATRLDLKVYLLQQRIERGESSSSLKSGCYDINTEYIAKNSRYEKAPTQGMN